MTTSNSVLISTLVLCSLLSKEGYSSFFAGVWRSQGECNGSILLNGDPSQAYHSPADNLNMNHMKVRTVRLEGCGCFRLFQRSGGRGRSQRIYKQGTTLVHLRRVGSLDREQCDQAH